MKKSFTIFFTLLIVNCSLFIVNCSLLIAKEATRLSNGTPSGKYWQQRVDYNIKAELLPEKKLLNGKGTITYYNNSPDTLKTLVWHLYQNVFRKDSSPRKNDEQSSRAFGTTEGITIEKIIVAGAIIVPNIDETIMEIPLPQPLLPNSKIEIAVEWNYDIPKNPSLRTGSLGNDFGICQWYPQIAVYDDQRGWDREQYLGRAEFYLEYGNWNVELTLPKNFIVSATGVLQNAQEVLTAEQFQRLNSLSKDSVSKIILPDETGKKSDSINNEKRTWKFSAENIRDFAWAASPEYVWDGTKTVDGVNIYAFYKAKDYRASIPLLISDASNWDDGAKMAKHAIEFYSAHYGKYIYPQATVVSGPVEGMEYPMMIFASDGDALSNTLEIVIAHELGHQWYPMMIGSHETNYPFMDEGFNTYITSNAVTDYSGDNGIVHKDFAKKYSWMNLPKNNERLFEQQIYLSEARNGRGASILSHPYNIPNAEYGVMAYQKPAATLVMLEDVLGKEIFYSAMLEYYNRWKFKHPYPQDFFNTMEDVSGRNLDWFWNQWFENTWKLDLAVDNVKNEEQNGLWKSTITISNKEQARMPATLELHLSNGITRTIRYSESIFDRSSSGTIIVDSLPTKVTNVIIDPAMKLADVNRLNNSWCMPRVEFDYGLNLVNYIIPPIDAYRINAAPVVGFNLRDGFEIGTSINGSYLATEHSITASTKYGTRSDVPDFEIAYSTPIRMWDPQLTTSARAFRLDGFSGWQLMVEKIFDQRKSLFTNYRRQFTFNTNILSILVNDARYLGNPAEWNTAGRLDAGFISVKYFESFSWGRFAVRLDDEFGTPTSTFSYSKFSVEAKLDHSLFFGMKMNWRLFSGSSNGNVPVQTAYSLTQSTPLERFDSWLFRTPVFGQSMRSHLLKPGGGNLFLTHDTTAAQVLAANVSLSSNNIIFFGNAGTLWDSTTTRLKKFYYDAGIGYQVTIRGLFIGHLNTGQIGLGIYFPLWVKDPSRPTDKEFDYRWKVVFGVRL